MNLGRTRRTKAINRPRSLNLSVDTLDSRLVPAVITVTGTGDSIARDGVVTLREAIIAANTNQACGDASAGSYYGADTIRFNIRSDGLQSIALTSALPTITGSVIIDGSTQGYYAGTPLIEINGARAGYNCNGLVVAGGNSTIKGIAVNNFRGAGIVLQSNYNTVKGCYVGIDYRGLFDQGNGTDGIRITGMGNTVGGYYASDRNVISGNDAAGVHITGYAARSNTVLGNYIGTDGRGYFSVYNADGVLIDGGAAYNRIGGTYKTMRNVITGNYRDEVRISGYGSSANSVQGNFIGVDSSGKSASLSGRDGVRIEGGATYNTVGGSTYGAGNLIAGQGARYIYGQPRGAGVVLGGFGTTGNSIQGNRIGMNAAGTGRLMNQGGGILIQYGATGNTIGGYTSAAKNVISDQVNAAGLASTNQIMPWDWYINSLFYMRTPSAMGGVFVG